MSTMASASDRGLSKFHPVRTRKAPEEVVAVLIDALRAGLYVPGDMLPRERDLAARLKVSRVVLREAIDQLRDADILEPHRGRTGGWMVSSLENLGRLQAGLRGERISTVRAILEMRRSLELTAALITARSASDEALERLDDQVEALIAAAQRSAAEFWTVDITFHLTVAELTENPLLVSAMKAVLDETFLLREFLPVGHVPIDAAIANQREYRDVLSGRDEIQITRHVDNHLAALEDVLLGIRLEFGCVPRTPAIDDAMLPVPRQGFRPSWRV